MDINTILSLIQTVLGFISLILTISIPQQKGDGNSTYTKIIIDNDSSGSKKSNTQTKSTSTSNSSDPWIFAVILIILAFFFFVLQNIFFTLTSLIAVGTVVCVSIQIRKKHYLFTKLHKSYIYAILFLILISTVLLNFLKLFRTDVLTGCFIFFKISGFVFLLINVRDMFKLFLKLWKEEPVYFTTSKLIRDIIFSIISILLLSGGWLVIYYSFLKPFFAPSMTNPFLQ